MNKSNIEAGQAGTTDESSTTAQNQHVSQPNANTNVVGSLLGQREIKFRAWDYFNEVMIYDSDDETDFKFYGGKPLIKYVTEQHTVENGIDIDRPIWNQVDGPVMQYTGLKDKNGKEIYEGDILKMYYSRDMSGKDIVVFSEVVEFQINEGVGTSGFDISFLQTSEIVGNIFENPELL